MNPRTLAHLDSRKGSTSGFSLKGPQNAALALVALVVFATAGLLLTGAFQAEAAASGSSAFDINGGNPVTVGTASTYTFTIRNTSTTPQDTETVQLTAITGYPACDAIELTTPLCTTAANQNAGVFVPVGVGTGVAGTACAGATFTVSTNAAGLWTFTPLAPATYPVLQPSNLGANPTT